jgi:hypothetical protein
MATITPAPLYFKDAVLEIDGDDYAPAASSATLTPSVSATTFYGLKPDAMFPESSVDWSLELTFVQDWDSASSLSKLLWDNQGTVIAGAILKPRSGEGPSFEMDIHVVPGAIGGSTRAHATATVSLPVVGVPELVEPV